MAQGDVIADITDLAAETFYVIQPGAGESFIIDDFFASGGGAANGYGGYYDGTDAMDTYFETDTSAGDFISYRAEQAKTHQETMWHINNDLYWHVYNRDAGDAYKCGIVAIQIQ